MIKILSRPQIVLLHKQLIERYGGTYGIRDEGLLDSALNAPFQSFGGIDFFPTVIDKAVIPFLLQSVYNLSKKRGGAKWQGHQREKNF